MRGATGCFRMEGSFLIEEHAAGGRLESDASTDKSVGKDIYDASLWIPWTPM